MGGIAGYIVNKPVTDSSGWITPLLTSIRGRGPDDDGITLINTHLKKVQSFSTDQTVTVMKERLTRYAKDLAFPHDIGFLHTRYAVMDLTYRGHQPFFSSDDQIIAVYHGEIYNTIELRNKLKSEGARFQTACDTEVLVEGYRVWGDRLWPQLNGFWAVVLYDRRDNTVVFSRDRVGVAPLYYRNTEQGLFFASVLFPLAEHVSSRASINRDAVVGFIQTGIKDHEGTTFYQDIRSFPSASFVKVPANACHFHDKTIHKYWDFPKKRLTEKEVSFKDAMKTFHDYFFHAVELRLRSDVKVAFELNSGLDSSCVVAAAAAMSGSPVSTYMFNNAEAEEEPCARVLLQKYTLDFHVIRKGRDNFLNDLYAFGRLMEEPFGHPNAYTRHQMLRRIKKEGVHILVTGTGGDEVFAGYESEFWPTAYQEMKKDHLNNFFRAYVHEFCRRLINPDATQNPSRQDRNKFPHSLHAQQNAAAQASQGGNLSTKARQYADLYPRLNFQQKCLYHFTTAQIPFEMRSRDHLAMNIPLEQRFPMLDHHVIEIGLQLPLSYLFKNGWTKYLIRRAMEPYLPEDIVWSREIRGPASFDQTDLTQNKPMFEPLLEELKKLDLNPDAFGAYDRLLQENPARLWRVISVGIWLKCSYENIFA